MFSFRVVGAFRGSLILGSLITTNDTKDTNMGARGFLSCGSCFSWFTDSGHDELKG